jgi:ABC-2 type transport system ATP-binding protein
MPPAAWAARLQALPDGGWRFNFSEYGELEALLAGVRGAGGRVNEMQLVEADLEDVFTDIMARV